jgi:hypothetical protein
MCPAMIYYVGSPFTEVEGGLAPGQAVECLSDATAIGEPRRGPRTNAMPVPS